MGTLRIIGLFFILGFASKGCDPKLRDEMKRANIEYQAVSRGLYLNISVRDEKLAIVDKRDGKPREYELTTADWNELAKLFHAINPKEIPNYEAPTKKRFYDGAAIANLRIVYDGTVYESQPFDHGTPPFEIAAFVNKIVSFYSPKAE